MPVYNENKLFGLPPAGRFQAGRSNVDNGEVVERGVSLPWVSDPAASWSYFECTVGSVLDSGIVIHNRLPQVDNSADTLAARPLGLDDPSLDLATAEGVNLKCLDEYEDIVQRMGHARYWFRIWGQAMRFGYQIPIPGIKTIGGVPAVPYDKNPQWAFNRIAPGGNYGGVILWHAMWSLWYTTAVPPRSNAFPAADPSVKIMGRTAPPRGLQAPYSQPDGSAVQGSARPVPRLPIPTRGR